MKSQIILTLMWIVFEEYIVLNITPESQISIHGVASASFN